MRPNFQNRVREWFVACFKGSALHDTQTRVYRFLEESLELGQAAGCTREEALQLVAYVYDRPAGVIAQEVGGVSTTLAMVCESFGLDLSYCAEAELENIWKRIEEIRRKDAAKKGPLPGK